LFHLKSGNTLKFSFCPFCCSYKIYAEGYAWSVSLKYILSCGSLALIISPQYEDFFTRGLIPKYNYWPVSPIGLCHSIRFAVDWGNANPSEVNNLLAPQKCQDLRTALTSICRVCVRRSLLMCFPNSNPVYDSDQFGVNRRRQLEKEGNN